jgi:hypothetical protein
LNDPADMAAKRHAVPIDPSKEGFRRRRTL